MAAVGFCAVSSPGQAADLVSVNTLSVAANGPSNGVALDGDGGVSAFYSDGNDLVTGDTNQARDVFVRDRSAGTTERASVSSSGAQADGASQAAGMAPAISSNGQLVAFYSEATNLIDGTSTAGTQVFLRDRGVPSTELISINPSGTAGDGPSLFPSVSADGNLVAFQSLASDLVPGGTAGVADIYVRDRGAGTTERLCGVQPDHFSTTPSISADGNMVAFASAATNLVSVPTNAHTQVYVCDRTVNSPLGITLVSVNNSGAVGNGDSILPAISADGHSVAFKSVADNLVPNDINGLVDVFVRDLAALKTELISVGLNGANANDVSFPPAISGDGRYVAFGSFATNLVVRDVNAVADVFLRDRHLALTVEVDVTSNGQQADAGTPDVAPAVSTDGKQIGFVSFADNLAPNTNNGTSNVFAGESPFICTQNSDCPPPTVCRQGMCSPFQCDNSTDCGTSGRESCVNHSCECTGDCNLDQMVDPSEVETCVEIFGEQLPITACPAADQDGDSMVSPAEVEIAVDNFGLGCPPRVH